MLKVEDIYARSENTDILKGVSLRVQPGEVHVILGPNGSGKSTLGRVLLGDSRYTVTQGSAKFLGQDLLALPPDQRAKAGFFLSFQSPPTLDGITVQDLLLAATGASSAYKFKKELKEALESLRADPNLAEREAHKGFSGGEQKKIEAVSLLTLDSKLAFLDEIDSGIDVDTVHRLGAAIRTYLKDKSRAIILVTHSEKLLKEITPTHVHILCQGVILHSGGPELIAAVHRDGFDGFGPKKPSAFKVLK